jgi:PAS domain S-box-containing protein
MGNSDVYQTLVNLSDDAIICTDEQGLIIIWNKAAEHAFEQKSDFVIGNPLISAIPDQSAILHLALEEVLKNKKAGSANLTIVREQEAEQHFTVRLLPLPGVGASLMFENVTELLKLQQSEQASQALNESLETKIAERTAQLEASSGELESFSYSVSHDLRAPLRIINSYSHLLQTEFGAFQTGEAAMFLEVIQTNVRKMNRQIEALLNLARMGTQKLIMIRADMEALVHDILADYNGGSNKVVSFQVGKLPSTVCDIDLITHVWHNLVANAVKFSANIAVPEVIINAHKNGNEVVYSIKDNGVGFDMRYSDKLFKVFQRLHSQSEYEGTGIGLALVAKIIHKHEGKVWAEAIPGAGATFYFSLPAAPQTEERLVI